MSYGLVAVGLAVYVATRIRPGRAKTPRSG